MISIARWNGYEVIGTINKGRGVLENCLYLQDEYIPGIDRPNPTMRTFTTLIGRIFGYEKFIDIPLDELNDVITNEQLTLRDSKALEAIEKMYKEVVGNVLIGV